MDFDRIANSQYAPLQILRAITNGLANHRLRLRHEAAPELTPQAHRHSLANPTRPAERTPVFATTPITESGIMNMDTPTSELRTALYVVGPASTTFPAPDSRLLASGFNTLILAFIDIDENAAI